MAEQQQRTAVIKSVDTISQSKSAQEAWFQRGSGARLFHNVMLFKDIGLSCGRCSAQRERRASSKTRK